MLTLEVENPEEAVLLKTAQTSVAPINTAIIQSSNDYEIVAGGVSRLQREIKDIEDFRMSITRPLDVAKKTIMDKFRGALDLRATAVAHGKRLMIAFREAEEHKRREEQRRIDELARKERARLAAEAAAVEAKARQQAEEARRQAAEAEQARLRAVAEGNAKAAAAAAERNAKLAERADALESAGIEKAAELATISELVVAPTVISEATKVAGQSIRRIWKARVTDKQLFLLAVANNPQYTNLVDVNQSALDRLAKALEGNFKVDGAEAYNEASLSSRSA